MRARTLRIVSRDKILRFINTLIINIIIVVCVCVMTLFGSLLCNGIEHKRVHNHYTNDLKQVPRMKLRDAFAFTEFRFFAS